MTSLRENPVFPMCKLAEYTITASSPRRRSLVRNQLKLALDQSDKRLWWHTEARGEIRKFFRTRSMTSDDLLIAASRLRDEAVNANIKESKHATLVASARAIEAFAPISELVRDKDLIVSAGRRDNAWIHRGNVRVVVAPDLLFLERGTEHVVGALKLHATQEFKLGPEALTNAAAILFTYLQEAGERPQHAHCIVVDVFSPAFEEAPQRLQRRMQAVEAACEEIDALWHAMYDRVKAEISTHYR
jgi:hypothetical protein